MFLGLAAWRYSRPACCRANQFGFALKAIHQDEDAAAAMGMNTTLTKALTLGRIGPHHRPVGAAYAFQQVTFFPDRLFDVEITVLMVVMVVGFGGGRDRGRAGTRRGGVAVPVGVPAPAPTPTVHTFVLGRSSSSPSILLPQGAVNYVREARRTREFSLLANVRRYRL